MSSSSLVNDFKSYISDVYGKDYEKRFVWATKKYKLINKASHSSMHGKVRALYFNELQYLYQDKENYGFGCGGFPISIRNKDIIGAITVSGLPNPKDHLHVVETLEKMLNIKVPKIPLEVDES